MRQKLAPDTTAAKAQPSPFATLGRIRSVRLVMTNDEHSIVSQSLKENLLPVVRHCLVVELCETVMAYHMQLLEKAYECFH